jgi:predicted dehydrogenase
MKGKVMNRDSKNRNTLSNRREFLASTTALAAFTIIPRHVLAQSGEQAPSDRMNIGCVGVGGMQGGNDVRSVSSENIYALCDVDENHLNQTAMKYEDSHPKLYRDFRVMLDREYKNLDGITITIPDHMHSTVALWAMERGLHVYCQKPLTQTIWEARLLSKAAKKYNVVTQMGNQGLSSRQTREVCEIIWSGEIGNVREVHSWSGGGFSRGVTEWPAAEEVPDTLMWDLWTGRAREHCYSSKIHPINWRGFQEYGSQMVGDWGIHMLGPANWALQLDSPVSVECTAVKGVNPVTYPHYSCKMEFPERPNQYVPSNKMPPVTVYWYEGEMSRNFEPPEDLAKEDIENMNALFVGSKGYLGTGGHGNRYSLLPKSKMEDYQLPEPVLERSPGHFDQWIQACKEGGKPCSDFSIAGPYTEWILLGSICWRFPNEKLMWDGKNMRFTNNEKANEYVRPYMRKGWELHDIEI